MLDMFFIIHQNQSSIMKKFLCLVVFSAFLLNVKAQTGKPFWEFSDNIVWTFAVGSQSFLNPILSKDSLSYESEVVFCGKIYSKIHAPSYQGINDTFYVRNEGRKTYFRLKLDCAQPELLLYDFDVEKNEIFTLIYDAKFPISFTVSNIDSVFLLSKFRKRISLNYIFVKDIALGVPPKTMVWVEGIGANLHPFYISHLFPQLVDPFIFWHPLCYYQQSSLFDSNKDFVNCEPKPASEFPLPRAKIVMDWDVLETYNESPPTLTNRFIKNPTKDTLICGRTYSNYQNKLFYRNENNKTLYYNGKNCNASEDVPFYDFDLKVGQSIKVPSLATNFIFDFKVTKIDTLMKFGVARKRLYLNYAPNLSMEWIEGIGSGEHPFYVAENIQAQAVDGRKYDLICAHQSSIFKVYQNPKYSTCKVVATDDLNNLGKEISVFPNPVNNELSINVLDNSNDLKISIFSIAGQEISSYYMNSETLLLNVDFLPQGFYVLKIVEKTSKKSAIVKIIKK